MIVDKRNYTEADACDLVKQVLSGISYLHSVCIV
jgi:serine/threonine protein kinase